jgi:cytochrome P450/ferredoxin-NADP reductase
MQPAPESSKGNSSLPASVARPPVIDYGTDEFRGGSVRILSAACESSPVCRVLPHDVPGLLRFRDVDAVLRDPLTFSSKVGLIEPPAGTARLGVLIGDDPPDHTRLRALFGQAFIPARVSETMEPRILAIARDLVTKILERGREVDLVADLAVPLPVTVISELLGVDARDMPAFREWSDQITGGLLVTSMPEGPEKLARMATLNQALTNLDAYLTQAIAEQRKHPGENLLSFMIEASEGREKLTSEEMLGLAKLLLVAGNETTTKLIGLMMNQLLSNPPALQELIESPGLIPNAIEEAVRIEGPVYNRLRRTTRACEIAGVALPAGALVDCVLGAANLDSRVFTDPTRFDIRRKIPRHLGFGGGIHQCLGAPLARIEARIAFEELFEHVESIELAGTPRRGTVSSFRGFESMPLRYQLRRRRASMPAEAKRAMCEVAVADRIARKSDDELGLTKREKEVVRVARVRDLAENIKLFRFVHPSGGLLTRFTAGSHIVLHMRDGETIIRNPYSLLNCEYGNGQTYMIAVALDPRGKGGSRYMHEKVRAGMELEISVPANNFPVAQGARKHLLIAGGIGITPIFAQRLEIRGRRQLCELHYTFRSAASAALVEMLELESDPNVHFYDNALGHRLDVASLLRAQPDPQGTALYVCGPQKLMDEVIEVALRLGWPKDLVRYERFGAPRLADDEPFTVVCARSRRELVVGGRETLLEALERAGYTVPFSCRSGSCGACELPVLEGEIVHRDSVLSDQEKADGRKILACVSRGKKRLVLAV